MSSAESVKGTLFHFWEAADAAVCADGMEEVAATCKDFVGVSLMADIPDDLVVGGVEDVVESNAKFDGTQRRRQMSRVRSQRIDNFFSQFDCELREVGNREFSKVFDAVNIF